jgi:outer membrane protein, multidrug efflux system
LETTLPVFEGGRRRAEMQRAYSVYRQTTDGYRSTVLSAFREVSDSLSREQQLQLEEQQLQAAVEAATKTQKMSMALYTGDLTNYLDVVTAQIAALEAHLAEVEVQMRRYQNTVSLIRALGGGWSNTELPTMQSIAPMKVTQYSHLATPSAVQPQDASR